MTGLLERGGAGVARIPGKQGGPAPHYAVVQVVIGDQPGELARLFQAAGEAGVNIEDVGIEHSPRPAGPAPWPSCRSAPTPPARWPRRSPQAAGPSGR